MEIYPPTFAKRWGIKKIPPSPGPRGPWDKRKKSGIFRNIQEKSGIFRNFEHLGDLGVRKFFSEKDLGHRKFYPQVL